MDGDDDGRLVDNDGPRTTDGGRRQRRRTTTDDDGLRKTTDDHEASIHRNPKCLGRSLPEARRGTPKQIHSAMRRHNALAFRTTVSVDKLVSFTACMPAQSNMAEIMPRHRANYKGTTRTPSAPGNRQNINYGNFHPSIPKGVMYGTHRR